MCCVLCCMRTCWLADAFPADADECKQKQKRYLPDGGHGCVAFVRVGVIYLCGCVRMCWLADALPADADECKQYIYTYLMDTNACRCVGWLMCCLRTRMSVNKKEKYIYLPDGRGCVRTCWLADALPADADEYKQKRKKIYLPDGGCGCVAMHADADGGQMGL